MPSRYHHPAGIPPERSQKGSGCIRRLSIFTVIGQPGDAGTFRAATRNTALRLGRDRARAQHTDLLQSSRDKAARLPRMQRSGHLCSDAPFCSTRVLDLMLLYLL